MTLDPDPLPTTLFPVLDARSYRTRWPDCPAGIPWEVVEPHRARALRNHYQSLERLAARGGLSPQELACVLLDEPYRTRTLAEAAAVIQAAVPAPSRAPTGRSPGRLALDEGPPL